MMNKSINALYKNNHLFISPQIILSMLSNNSNHYIFLKDTAFCYQYANQEFLDLLGIHNFSHLHNSQNKDFYKDKKAIKCYQKYDEHVIEEGSILSVCETIFPRKNNKLTKLVEGKLYPLFSDNGKVSHILGVVTPKIQLCNFDWNTIFVLSQEELDEILIKRSYPIQCNGYQTTLSKMEIKTLVQLVKGETAHEISQTLQIKQTTVESYLKNIRNKLSASSKSELINVLIRDHVLQQIVVSKEDK